MKAIDDRELLAMYVRRGDQLAFRALVDRHVNLVYGICRRQLRDGHLAEDATQAVFVVLARKAGRIRSGLSLCGWLYNTARYVAANALRAEAARRRSEMEAARRYGVGAGDAIAEMAPQQLDHLLSRLKRAEREAILLRFFQGHDFPEVAAALRISEAAARKRVSRGIDRLRVLLGRRGEAVSAAAVASALAGSATTAPAALAGAATIAAMGGAGVAVLQLAKGGMIMAALSKAKTVGVAVLALVLLGGAAAYVVMELARPAPTRGRMLALEKPAVTTRAAIENGALSFETSMPANEGDAMIVRISPAGGERSSIAQFIERPRAVEVHAGVEAAAIPAGAVRRRIQTDASNAPPPARADGTQAQGDIIVIRRVELSAGDPLPDAALKTLTGEKINLSALASSYVLVHFWSPADPAESLEAIRSAYQKWGPGGKVRFIGICGDMEAEEARKLVEDRRIAWSQVHDRDWTLRRDIGGRRSSAYLFDTNGRMIAGPIVAEDLSDKLLSLVKAEQK